MGDTQDQPPERRLAREGASGYRGRHRRPSWTVRKCVVWFVRISLAAVTVVTLKTQISGPQTPGGNLGYPEGSVRPSEGELSTPPGPSPSYRDTPDPRPQISRGSRRQSVSLRERFVQIALKAPRAAGRPNLFTRWYSSKTGGGYLLSPWCAMFVDWVASRSGVRLSSSAAYTPDMATGFQRARRWFRAPQAGDLVFFDWSGGRSIDGIDHVEIVTKVFSSGTFTTIGGNISNAVSTQARNLQFVVGFGRPNFT